MTAQSWPPSHEEVVSELKTVRERRVGGLRRLNLPALHLVAIAADTSDSVDCEHAAIHALLRNAIDHLGGGDFQESAEHTIGLRPGYNLSPTTERRRQAAKNMNIAPDTFRKDGEKVVVEQVAEGVLALGEQSMRIAHSQMECRHPADTRHAVARIKPIV